MTDPYQPQQLQYPGQPTGGGARRPMARLAAGVLLLITLLIAANAVFQVFAIDSATLMQEVDPNDLAEMEAAGMSADSLVNIVRACGGACGLIIVGIGVLLAAFTWHGKAWAMITSIVLLGIGVLLNLLGLVAMLALASDPEVAAANGPVTLAVSVVLTLLEIVAIVLLALALRERAGSTGGVDEQQQAAWQQYYAQGGTPPEQNDQQGWGGSSQG